MKSITTFVIAFLFTLAVNAQECRKYTEEQISALVLSYNVGKPHDLSYTLMAIVERESFVGSHVIRVNSKDGKYGSYGISHINLETAMWLEGVGNQWEARAEVAPRLIVDDLYSLNLSLRKLETNANLGWSDMVRSYNGSVRSPKTLEYLDGIRENINKYRNCWGR